MKTDYQNLQLFEGLVVFMIAIGIGLIGTMTLMSIPEQQQTNFKQAVAILDIHEQAKSELIVMKASAIAYSNFLDKFYIASTEVLALDGSNFGPVVELIGLGQEGTGKILALHPKPGGEVLGVSIEKCSDPPPEAYTPPRFDLELVKNNLNKLIP